MRGRVVRIDGDLRAQLSHGLGQPPLPPAYPRFSCRIAALACLFVALLLPTAAACARDRRAEPLPYIELVTGSAAADAELPLIIALHGRGDTAEDFAPLFRDFAVPARVAVLRPPHPWGAARPGLSARARTSTTGPSLRPSCSRSPIVSSPRPRRSGRSVRRAGGLS